MGSVRGKTSSLSEVVAACEFGLDRNSVVSRDHGDTRRSARVFVVCVAKVLWFGVVLDVVLSRVERIVSWPQRLRSIVGRGCEEWLLGVGLVVLSVGIRHPVCIRLHVRELRTCTMPFELMLRTCRRRIGRACCHRNALSTVLVSTYEF